MLFIFNCVPTHYHTIPFTFKYCNISSESYVIANHCWTPWIVPCFLTEIVTLVQTNSLWFHSYYHFNCNVIDWYYTQRTSMIPVFILVYTVLFLPIMKMISWLFRFLILCRITYRNVIPLFLKQVQNFYSYFIHSDNSLKWYRDNKEAHVTQDKLRLHHLGWMNPLQQQMFDAAWLGNNSTEPPLWSYRHKLNMRQH